MNASHTAARRVQRKRAAPVERQVDKALQQLDRPLHEAVRPLLVEVGYLRQRESMPPADVVFERARNQLNQTRVRLEALAITPEEVRDIYYALVAFVDEAMQADQGPLKDFWQAHLLQLELFGETRAGEGFFERLAQAEAAGRLAVVRIYYLCLLFGFRGIYAQHGDLERENLIESVRQTLGIDASERARLAPFGARPDEPLADRQRNRLLQWFAWCAAGMAFVWYVGIWFSLDAQARLLSGELQHASEDLKVGLTVPTKR